MKSWIKNVGCAILLIMFLIGCEKSEYNRLVKSELASGIRQDSLLFGIYFGDTSEDFYSKCWKLNKQGVIGHGPENMNVLYTMEMEGSDIELLFYPDFQRSKTISKMDMKFQYQAWAPWNDEYKSDKLLPVVLDSLKSWYGGNDFIKVNFEEGIQEIWVKVDGNRRISVTVEGDKEVLVRLVDMLYEVQ